MIAYNSYKFAGLCLIFSVFFFIGCQNSSTRQGNWLTGEKGLSPEEQLQLLLPTRIEILPFTKPKSWDNDPIPDGIEVVLRPLDTFGDQTKAVGQYRFELYVFQNANSNPRGKRIGFWEEDLSTKASQYKHWDRITRTYRFRLAWTEEKVKPGRYVLDVTYTPPTGDRLKDTFILEARIPREVYKEKIEGKERDGFKLF
jgi:hypothetical protein